MQLIHFATTDVGLTRKNNEDYFLGDSELGVFIVCDGVGGHAAGEVASNLAAQTVHNYLSEHRDELQKDSESVDLLQLVEDAVQAACAEVHRAGKEDKSRAGMATTLTMLLLCNDKGVMGHVGDCRLYLKRRGRIHQLSNDHTLVNELYQQGTLTKAQMEESPYSNVLTRSLGTAHKVQVDTLLFDVLPDDIFVLASDGFTKALRDNQELERMIDPEDLEHLPRKLTELANSRGGYDNATVLVAAPRYDQANAAAQREHSEEVMLRIDTLKQMYVFQDLTLRELLTVMEITTVFFCRREQVLVRDGDKSDGLYIILDGEVEVFKGDKCITRLRSGNHFGEMALLNESPRTATVRAAREGKMLVIQRDAFLRLITQRTDIGVKLLRKFAGELSTRLDRATQALAGDAVI